MPWVKFNRPWGRQPAGSRAEVDDRTFRALTKTQFVDATTGEFRFSAEECEEPMIATEFAPEDEADEGVEGEPLDFTDGALEALEGAGVDPGGFTGAGTLKDGKVGKGDVLAWLNQEGITG